MRIFRSTTNLALLWGLTQLLGSLIYFLTLTNAWPLSPSQYNETSKLIEVATAVSLIAVYLVLGYVAQNSSKNPNLGMLIRAVLLAEAFAFIVSLLFLDILSAVIYALTFFLLSLLFGTMGFFLAGFLEDLWPRSVDIRLLFLSLAITGSAVPWLYLRDVSGWYVALLLVPVGSMIGVYAFIHGGSPKMFQIGLLLILGFYLWLMLLLPLLDTAGTGSLGFQAATICSLPIIVMVLGLALSDPARFEDSTIRE